MGSPEVLELEKVAHTPPSAVADNRDTVAEENIAIPPTGQPATGSHSQVYIFKRLRRPMAPPTKWRRVYIVVGLCLSMILCGWTEGSVGPLIPSLQKHYNINYLKMSLIYLTGFVGSMFSGFLNVWITDRLGFGLSTTFGAICSAIGYIFMATGANYAVWLVAFIFTGFGLGLQDAQVNNLTSRLPNASNTMQLVQACFSLGGTIAPLASTAFAEHVEEKSYLYFWVATGVAVFSAVVMFVCFDMRTEEQIDGTNNHLTQTIIEPAGAVVPNVTKAEQVTNDEASAPTAQASSGAKMKLIFSTPAVYALLGFSFIYIGVEVAISSWAPTFLVRERGGSAKVGYVTTGFWGGMTVGRIVMIPVTNKLGYQRSIYLYSLLSLVFELIIWFTHNVVGNAICYALIGAFLGPVYPIGLMVVSEVLDDSIRAGVMGLMGAMGGAGAAAVPFIAGAIADAKGIWVVHPIAVAMIAGYTALWALVPTKKKVAKAVEPGTTPAETVEGSEASS